MITDEKEDVDMEGCPTSNNNPNGSASGTASTGTPGNGNSSGGIAGGGGKGRKGDMPVKKEPDAGGGIGADGESKGGDVDMKLPLHAVATHPVSNGNCRCDERCSGGKVNRYFMSTVSLSPLLRMYKQSAVHFFNPWCLFWLLILPL
jgi:hypothetical protein